MDNRVLNASVASAPENRYAGRRQFDQGLVVPKIELTIEPSPQSDKGCHLCAEIPGRYCCVAERSDRAEWRYAQAGIELIVGLVQPQGGTSPRLMAYFLLTAEGFAHARAIYSSEPLKAGRPEGPLLLKVTSAESECDFLFPSRIEVIAIGKLATPAAEPR
jgi:hypothetical protein